ncbi:IS3 family transposase [Phascolarctobacterium succinatutens]|nr:IS3 family transposase [Phascolarctobacterium succinatutens]
MRSSNSNAVAEYIDYYNNRRIQAKAKWMPSSKFREASMMGRTIVRSTI